ncbi:MAG: DUF5812 family protein [Haloarculaceae archaeon]
MKQGTFLVTHADEGSATLRDVADGQVVTLSSNPGVEPEEVLEATVQPEPPMELTWEIVEIDARRTIPVEHTPEAPTRQAVEIADEQPVGEITRRERAGEGEIHVLTVPSEETESAVDDVLDDESTRERAARLGVERVEIRAAEGVVSVRYLP